jgi:hypothetical protein
LLGEDVVGEDEDEDEDEQFGLSHFHKPSAKSSEADPRHLPHLFFGSQSSAFQGT